MILELYRSELASWLRCETQHYDTYVNEVGLAGETALNLQIGKLWHSMLEEYHRFDMGQLEHGVEVWTAHTGGFEYATGDWRWLPKMLIKYHEWYKASGYKVLLVERELRIPWAPTAAVKAKYPDLEVILLGTIDRLYIDGSGQYWIGEDKTTTQHSNAHLLTDPQGLTYMLYADELDLPVEGVLYVQAKKHNPESPNTKTATIAAYPVPFSDQAKRSWGHQLDNVIARVVHSRLDPFEEVEPTLFRRFNPLPWMSCFCPLEAKCLGWLHGRDTSDLYEHVNPNAWRNASE